MIKLLLFTQNVWCVLILLIVVWFGVTWIMVTFNRLGTRVLWAVLSFLVVVLGFRYKWLTHYGPVHIMNHSLFFSPSFRTSFLGNMTNPKWCHTLVLHQIWVRIFSWEIWVRLVLLIFFGSGKKFCWGNGMKTLLVAMGRITKLNTPYRHNLLEWFIVRCRGVSSIRWPIIGDWKSEGVKREKPVFTDPVSRKKRLCSSRMFLYRTWRRSLSFHSYQKYLKKVVGEGVVCFSPQNTLWLPIIY